MTHYYCPYYEGLSIEAFHEKSLEYEECRDIWPILREFARLPRQWVLNICATIGKEDFDVWCKTRIAERNNRVSVKRKLFLEMEASVAEAFHNSTAVSSKSSLLDYFSIFADPLVKFVTAVRGSGHNLLKGNNRRRTKAELEEHHRQEEAKEALIGRKDAVLLSMSHELREAQEKLQVN